MDIKTVRKIAKHPKIFHRYLKIREEHFNVPKSSNLFIGGVSGRTGTTWLANVMKDITNGRYIVIQEHGFFALSQFRKAGLELLQTGGSDISTKRYIKYLSKFISTYGYKRRRIYGEGNKRLSAIVPKRAIKQAFNVLERDLSMCSNLLECNLCLGRFYSSLLNWHSLLKGDTLNWINKEPGYGAYAKDLFNMIPDCKLLILVRDGRDVALSMARAGWFNRKITRCIDFWKDWTEMTLNGVNDIPQEHYLLIKYEDLISDFNTVMAKILSFFAMDSFIENLQNMDLYAHQNIPKTNNKEKWKKEFSKFELDYFDKECKDIMQKCGYDMLP